MMDMEELDPAAPAGGHVVLCGPNELGYRTLEELVRLGEHVVVVVRSPAEELARGARELGATLVRGSYRDQAVLHGQRLQHFVGVDAKRLRLVRRCVGLPMGEQLEGAACCSRCSVTTDIAATTRPRDLAATGWSPSRRPTRLFRHRARHQPCCRGLSWWRRAEASGGA